MTSSSTDEMLDQVTSTQSGILYNMRPMGEEVWVVVLPLTVKGKMEQGASNIVIGLGSPKNPRIRRHYC